MACRMSSAKPLPEPMLEFVYLIPKNNFKWYLIKIQPFDKRKWRGKCHLQNVDHFVPASIYPSTVHSWSPFLNHGLLLFTRCSNSYMNGLGVLQFRTKPSICPTSHSIWENGHWDLTRFDGMQSLTHLFPVITYFDTWWRHQMETFSALLAICAGNSPVPGEFRSQRPVTRALIFPLICVWINGWVNNREAGDLRRYRAHYDVRIMITQHCLKHENSNCSW